MKVLSLCYLEWSLKSLESDWNRNDDIWSQYIIQKDRDADMVRLFNTSLPVYILIIVMVISQKLTQRIGRVEVVGVTTVADRNGRDR